MELGGGLGHLTYSTLVHPGDTWDEMWNSLTTYVPAVKKRVSPDKPFGVSLRLAAKSAERLTREPEERQKLRKFLADNGMYLFTVNAFPYGPFKGERVKELVYEPDWRTDARALYTMQVADILAEVAPAGVSPSIQSPPCGFKPRVTGPDVVDAYTFQILRVVAHLIELEARTGRTVTLALEPEPLCFMEITSEAIAYFKDHLYSTGSIKTLSGMTGLNAAQTERALRRHLGIVYDICHQAVEFEDIAASLKSLKAAGVPVMKLQAAAAVRMPKVDRDIVHALKEYDDPVYLHQTIEVKDGKLERFVDLQDAFAAWDARPGAREWRTHFHVPVFLEDLGAFKTTRPAIEEALRVHCADPVSTQLEIETYTWDVLPDHLKTGDITDYVVRELEWVEGELAKGTAAKKAALAAGHAS
ncbi:MAG TPA: metabolite traffic protein EboE [Alphaproteobacteria bacterium]|nr:metabolite traffic protein EboE [Alphaproteobacteria bacterium]